MILSATPFLIHQLIKLFKSVWKKAASDSETMFLYIFASLARSKINEWLSTYWSDVINEYLKEKKRNMVSLEYTERDRNRVQQEITILNKLESV